MAQINLQEGVNLQVTFSNGTTIGGQTVGGSNGQIQYNANGRFGGVPGTGYNGSDLFLGNVGNVQIGGGITGQYLQTDGAGNLVWDYANDLQNGNSNVVIGSAGGDVVFGVNGNPDTFRVGRDVTTLRGNFEPQIGSVFSLGNAILPWLDAHISNTLYIDTTPLTGNGTHLIAPNIATGNITAHTLTGNVVGGTVSGDGWGIGNINGANIVGPIGNAIYSQTAGQVVDAAQPNITSLGTLVGLDVAGPLNVDVANLNIPGGNAGEVLHTDGLGNLYWDAVELSRISNGTSNVNIDLDQPVTISAAGVANVAVFGPTTTTIKNDLDVEDRITSDEIVSNTGVITTLTSQYANVGYDTDLTLLGGQPEQFLQTINGDGNVQWSYIRQLRNGNSTVTVDSNHWIHFEVAGIDDVVVITEDCIIGNFCGGNISADNFTADNANIGNIVAVNVEAMFGQFDSLEANTGNIANLTSSNFTMLGPVDLGDVANITIDGGTAGDVLTTDGTGNLSWTSIPNTLPGGNTTEVQFNAGGVFGGISTATWDGVALSLGSNANVKIGGGNVGEVLTTDSLGNLFWSTPASGGNVQPMIEFTAAGGPETFTNANLTSFPTDEFATVFINGVLAPPSDYDIVGNTLTFVNPLNAGDTVIVGPTGTIGGAGLGTVIRVGGQGSGLGFSLTGNVTYDGNLVLATPNVLQLRTTLNIGNVANLNLETTNAFPSYSVLLGNGTWSPLGNLAYVDYDTTDPLNKYLRGDGTWAYPPGGGNIANGANINSNVLTANTLTVYEFSNLGDIANIYIGGGSNGQVLITDGNGNLSWSNAGGVTRVQGETTGDLTIGFTLTGDVTSDGNLILDVPSVADLQDVLGIDDIANALANLGNISNIDLNGNGNTILAGNGAWINYGNIVDTDYNGNGNTILAGNGQWISTANITGVPNIIYWETDTSYTGTTVSVDSANANIRLQVAGQPYGNLGNTRVAIGQSSNAAFANSVAIGRSATSSTNSTAVGSNTIAGFNSVAIGYNGRANIDNAIAIGNSANATGSDAITIGSLSRSAGQYGVAIGYQANASSIYTVALGLSARAIANSSVALGPNTVASNLNSVAIGSGTESNIANTIVLGNSVYTSNIPGNLNVGGRTNLNSNSNITITGGSNNQVLTTDGSGNLRWSDATNPIYVTNWDSNANIGVGGILQGGINTSSTVSPLPGFTYIATATSNLAVSNWKAIQSGTSSNYDPNWIRDGQKFMYITGVGIFSGWDGYNFSNVGAVTGAGSATVPNPDFNTTSIGASFVRGGDDGSGDGAYIVSNGTTGTSYEMAAAVSDVLTAVATSGSRIVFTGQAGRIYHGTTLGGSFTSVSLGIGTNLVSDIFWDGTKFMVCSTVGSSAQPVIRQSTDGITWTTPVISGVSNHSNFRMFYAAGVWLLYTDTQIYSSTNGTAYTLRINNSATNDLTKDVRYENGQFMVLSQATGSAAKIQVSADGSTWTTYTMTGLPTSGWTAVRWNGGCYQDIAVAYHSGSDLIYLNRTMFAPAGTYRNLGASFTTLNNLSFPNIIYLWSRTA